jgi:hypothetical protein
MLAKVVCGDCLNAGYILRCPHHPSAFGEIRQQNDLCSHCQEPSAVTEPDWWLWLTGQRHQARSWRCRDCGVYFFVGSGPCGNAGVAHTHSRLPTIVWVPNQTVSLSDGPAGFSPPSDPGLSPCDGAYLAEALGRLAAMPTGPVRLLGETLFHDRLSPNKAARGRGFTDQFDLVFLQRWREALVAAMQPDEHDLGIIFPEDQDTLLDARRLLVLGWALEGVAHERRTVPTNLDFRRWVWGYYSW